MNKAAPEEAALLLYMTQRHPALPKFEGPVCRPSILGLRLQQTVPASTEFSVPLLDSV